MGWGDALVSEVFAVWVFKPKVRLRAQEKLNMAVYVLTVPVLLQWDGKWEHDHL